MNRALSVVGLFLCLAIYNASASTRPNILFILADDLGSADVGWRGSTIPTPNLDRLAGEGVCLEAHYTAPVCSPTRAGLLTGRYWSRFGINVPNSRQCLPDNTPTLASLLRDSGYQTALIGKWHLGGAALPNKRPNRFGFDHTYGSLDGAVHPFTHVYTSGGAKGDDGVGVRTWHRDGSLIDEPGHVTDLLTSDAIGFINRAQSNAFFLYLPYSAPHEKCLETREWMDKCAHISSDRQTYAAMIAHMDHDIGKIVAELERLHLRENTVIVFASDNGGIHQGLNDPWRAGKGTVYEGGVRNVAFVNWPSRLKPASVESPVCITDWFPTLAKLAGAKIPRGLKLDGRDIWQTLASQGKNSVSRRTIYLEGLSGQSSAIRQGDWKLLGFQTNAVERFELYNLLKDPAETTDLATTEPRKLRSLSALLKREKAKDDDSVSPELKSSSFDTPPGR